MSNTVINTNVLALNSHRALKNVGSVQAKSSEKLSTGQRINRAADDAAGLAISEKMRSQIRGLDRASANAQDGISLIQTAEGALQESENMLQRMRELLDQASNDSLEQPDRDKIALELDELTSEIGETSSRTEFNKKKLIDGSWESKQLYFQVGANSEQGLQFNISGMSDVSLGVSKSEIGDIVRGTTAAASTNQIKDAKVATAAVYDNTAFDGLTIKDSNGDAITMVDATGAITAPTTGDIKDIEGTTLIASGTAGKTIADLAGKTIRDGEDIYKVSADGSSISKTAFTANGTKLDLSVQAETSNGVNFTKDSASSGTTADVDLYQDDGTKLTAGTKLVDGEVYFTKDGSKGFSYDDTSTKLTTYDAAAPVATNTVTTPAANNTDLGKFAGDYTLSTGNKISIDANGAITKTGTTKDIDGAAVDVTNVTARQSKSFQTDAGLISFDATGTKMTIDKDIKGAADGSIASGTGAAAITVADGALTGVTAGDFELADGTTLNATKAADLAGKTIKSGANYVTIDADGKGVSTSTTAPVVAGTRNKVAQDAEDKFQTASKALKADPNSSKGKVISLVMDKVDAAIEIVSAQRAQLGAYQNRMEHTIKNLDVSSENLSGAESRIRDTDMAKEMMSLTKSNVLQQAATSMLAQANQAPQSILSLLR